jgi:hypothetical protein
MSVSKQLHIYRNSVVATNPFELTFLQYTEYFGLGRYTHVATFGGEQYASIGKLEAVFTLESSTGK